MSLVSTIGRLARPLRAGEDTITLSQPEFASVPMSITVTSPTFDDGQPLPLKYTVLGQDVSPPISWANLPSGTRDVVLIVEDYDIPRLSSMVHCIAYGLAPDKGGLVEGALPSRDNAPLDFVPRLGRNGLGFERYDGPAAPPGHGVHHYVFQIFAVSRALSFERAPSKDEILKALQGHVLATGRLTGTFQRE